MKNKLVIGVEADTSKFENQIKKLEMKREDKKLEIDVTTKNIEKSENQLKLLEKELDKTAERYDSLIEQKKRFEKLSKKPNLTPEENLDVVAFRDFGGYTSLQLTQDKMGELELRQQSVKNYIEEQNRLLERQKFSYEEITGEIIDTNKKIQDAKDKVEQTKFDKIKNQIDKVGSSVQNITKKITHWAFALIGIRSIYSGIRKAVSIVSGQNEEVANKIEQMRNILASALLPIATAIVNTIGKIMVYLNYIFKQLTGRNLFDFSKAMSNASSDLKEGAGAASEIRKQLAGFDEMNVLGDNVSSAGGVGKLDTKEFDNMFDSLQYMKIPKWLEDLTKILKTLKDNWQEVIIVVGAFAGAIAALKITNFITDLLKLEGITGTVKAGIALLTSGIILLAGSIINMTLNWDDMDSKQRALAVGIALLGEAMITLGIAMATGFSTATIGIGLLVGAVIGAITWIGTLIAKDYEERDALADVNYYQNQYTEAKREAQKALDDYVLALEEEERTQLKLDEAQQKVNISATDLYEQVIDGTKQYKDLSIEEKDLLKAYSAHLTASDALAEKTEELNKRTLQASTASSLAEKDYKKYGETLQKGMKNGIISSDEMSKKLIKDMKGMDNQARITFVENLPDEIKDAFDWNKYGSQLRLFAKNWNDYLDGLKAEIEAKIKIEYWQDKAKADTYAGVNHGTWNYAKGAMIYPPKLAIGGIINQPGRGVPLTSAIGGEHGAEGVIPLTDSQQMQLLGEAIGKYVTINASITNTMNGRVISRELQKVQNNSDFAFNR